MSHRQPRLPMLGHRQVPMLGHPPAPILNESWRGGQEPAWAGLPELLSLGTRPSGALLPTARWVCRQIDSGQLETGLAARAAREFTGQILPGWACRTWPMMLR
jgi:hypothetical protein